jgi:hypothetical protein
MCAVVPVHAVVERVIEAQPAVVPARACLDVNRLDRRLVPGDPAGARGAVAEVEIFHVHPVALVEESDLVEHLASHQHECTVDGVDRPLAYLRRPVRRERRRGTLRPADAEEVAERRGRCRE